MLIVHLVVVFLNIATATFINFRPSAKGIQTVKALTAAVFVTGGYLVISTHSSLTSACLAGLLYLGFVLASVASAQRRLAKQTELTQ
ncbi:MAG TPA: hypothetical protein VFW90_00135 [Candidatus Saccharimonadales bacterium]|nr:hypothetical protein [Candidatus Saccharimonadales bacterium]